MNKRINEETCQWLEDGKVIKNTLKSGFKDSFVRNGTTYILMGVFENRKKALDYKNELNKTDYKKHPEMKIKTRSIYKMFAVYQRKF